MNNIKLGTEARDIITGYTGIVIAEINYLTGNRELKIQKQIAEDNKYPPSEWIHESLLEQIGDGVHVEPTKRELGFTSKDRK